MKHIIKAWPVLILGLILLAGVAFKGESAYAPNGAKYESSEAAYMDEDGMVNVPTTGGVDRFSAFTRGTLGDFFFAPSGSFYERLYTLDTITNAANDTLYLPSNMRPLFSDFQMAVNILRTNISGTTNLAVKVEETNWPFSGTTAPTNGWVATLNSAGTAAATAATTATTEQLLIPHAYGINFRVIVDGTGTQVSSYRLRWTLKKKT